MSTIKSLITICELAIRAKDAELDNQRSIATAAHVERVHMQDTINLLQRDNERLSGLLTTFEAEVSRLATENKWLEEQRDNLLYTEITDENGDKYEARLHDLSLRVTHKYVGTWQHEDQWRSIGTYEVLQSSDMRTDDEDPCEPTRTMTLIKVRLDNSDHSKPPVTDQDVKRAIKDTMTHLGCSHEHDCCGCWNTLVHHVVKCETLPDGDEWFVTKHSIRNY